MLAKLVYLVFTSMLFASFAEGAFKLRNGKLIDADVVATLPVQEHFNRGIEAINQENWKEAARQFKVITLTFPDTPYGADSYYYLGVAEYNLDEFDFANEAFTAYLKAKNNPKFFQEAIEYKFAIADRLGAGSKKRFLGTKKLPKWASGTSLALEIYDEVITALPCHDLAARALYSKGSLLWNQKQYKRSIEAFQMIIKRFPKHELAPESYVTIAKIYLEQSRTEFQNPDVLEFAQINLTRFRHDFPRDERISEVEGDVLAVKEIYANGLYETGLFYERIDKPKASLIYYQNAIKRFPETMVAIKCIERLEVLCKLPPGTIGSSENLPKE